jgi:tetratricopeptide (TPR) repeat protein
MDYRTDRRMLEVVEMGHFQPRVEQLVKPMFRYFGADLNYTLYAFPNHHRALVTMVRLGEREKTDTPTELGHSIDCFFRRAIRFVPDDVIVRMLYAQYLLKKTRREEAVGQLEVAESFAGKEPMTYFNLGLLYVEMGQFEKAVGLAHRADALGVDIGVLKSRLQQVGHWREPER